MRNCHQTKSVHVERFVRQVHPDIGSGNCHPVDYAVNVRMPSRPLWNRAPQEREPTQFHYLRLRAHTSVAARSSRAQRTRSIPRTAQRSMRVRQAGSDGRLRRSLRPSLPLPVTVDKVAFRLGGRLLSFTVRERSLEGVDPLLCIADVGSQVLDPILSDVQQARLT